MAQKKTESKEVLKARLTLAQANLAALEAENKVGGPLYKDVPRSTYCRQRADHWRKREQEELAAEAKRAETRTKKREALTRQIDALKKALA